MMTKAPCHKRQLQLSLSWALQAPITTGPSSIQHGTIKNKTYALVKAHKRTEVYATVLGTDRQNVMCFQRVGCANHLTVDIKRGGEAQELHSIPAAQHQSKDKRASCTRSQSVYEIAYCSLQQHALNAERRGPAMCCGKRGGGMQVTQRTCSRRIVTQGRGVMKIGPKLLEWFQRVGSGA